MKKKTKFGLLLAAVATATFYVVHKLAGKAKPKAPPAHVDSTHAPPQAAPAPSPPHGSTVSHPNPATPADPFAPLPGQESLEGNVHFDQPGAASPGSTFVDTTQSGKEHPQPFQAPSDPSQYDQGKKKSAVVYQNPDGSKSSVDPTASQDASPVSDFVDSLNPWA